MLDGPPALPVAERPSSGSRYRSGSWYRSPSYHSQRQRAFLGVRLDVLQLPNLSVRVQESRNRSPREGNPVKKTPAQEGHHSTHPAKGIALDVRLNAVPVTLAEAVAGSFG